MSTLLPSRSIRPTTIRYRRVKRQMLRFKLSQDESFYISPTGNDANNGLTPTAAFATGQAARIRRYTLDLNNHNLILLNC